MSLLSLECLIAYFCYKSVKGTFYFIRYDVDENPAVPKIYATKLQELSITVLFIINIIGSFNLYKDHNRS